jgi:hypothetical protein
MLSGRQSVIPGLLLIAVLSSCSGGSAKAHPPEQSNSSDGTTSPSAAPHTPLARTTVTLADAVPPYPEGALHWPAKNTGYMDVNGFVNNMYAKEYQPSERSYLAKNGFVSSYRRGWAAPDGLESEVWLVKFSTSDEARYEYQSMATNWKKAPKPATAFADPEVDGEGAISNQLDSVKKSETRIATSLGEMFVYVKTYSPGAPDKAATMALMQQEIQLLHQKSG